MDDTEVKRVYQEDYIPGSVKPTALVAGSNTAGDIPYSDGTNFAKLGIGGAGSLLRVSSGAPSWLSVGTEGYFLTVSSSAPAWTSLKRIVVIPLLDDNTNNVVGDGAGDITFTVPSALNGWILTDADASVEVAGVTGTQDIQIHNVTDGVDMLSTKITIDTTELTSFTAATAPVINTANDDVATGDKLRFDVDAIHSGTAAKGLQMILVFEVS